MTKVMVTEEYLENTGDAIREKNGSSDLYTPAQFASAIRAIDTSGNTGSKSVTANGTYNASSDNLDGYDAVTVNVPNSYSASDEGKVVSSGALVAQTSTTKNANGTYDTTTNNSVTVNVQPNVGSKSISANGNYTASSDSLDGYSSVSVDVSNSYTASDEGKVVSSGALVAQTSKSINANGTYDTTANNSVVVDVPAGGSTLGTKTITQNGTYNASSDSLDGYSQVTVNVSGGDGDATLTSLMTMGQVSTTSAYATAQFDSAIIFSQYDGIMVRLYRGSDAYTTIVQSQGSSFKIMGGSYTYTLNLTSAAIKCTNYAGEYVNLYVDVYGVKVNSLS